MKTFTRLVLAFTLMMLLTGCFSSLYAPPRKALLQIESPPHRTTLLTDAEDMTPEQYAYYFGIKDKQHEDMYLTTVLVEVSSDLAAILPTEP